MSNKCMICSRNLDGSRIVSCSTSLKHTRRPIYELLNEEFAQYPFWTDGNVQKKLNVTDQIEDNVKFKVPFNKSRQDLQNIAKVPKLCFRCYRIVLGIDYHGYELRRLNGQIIKLIEDSKEKDIKDTKEDGLPIKSTIDSEINIEAQKDMTNIKCVKSIDSTDTELPLDENLSQNKSLSIKKDNVETHSILELVDPVFNSSEVDVDSGNTKRNRKCKRLLDFEYLDVNEKCIGKTSLNEKTEKKHEEFKIDTYSKSRKKEPILCRNCNEKFKTKKSFNSHGCLKNIPTINKKSYLCKVCGINMKSKQSYIEHAGSCYKNIEVQCSYCAVKLPSAAFLPRHMEAFHEGEPVSSKEVLCDHCGREFSRKESLDRHQAAVHGVSYGQHQCSQCGRTFLHTSLLAEHIRAHRGYNCDQCGKTFSCNSNLHLHLRTHHQNKHLYSCSQCNKQWKFHTSYIYHLRKVHGVNPHRCSRCRQHYSSEAEFISHKNSCHKIDSKLKNKQIRSRLSTHNDNSMNFLKSENVLIETDSKTKRNNENSSLSTRNEKKIKEVSANLPLQQHTNTAFTFVPQEIIVFKNQDIVYGKTDLSSCNTEDIIIPESDNENYVIKNTQRLMVKDKIEIGEPPIGSNVLPSGSFDFNNINKKEQVGYESNNQKYEYGDPHNKMSNLKNDVAELHYVHGDIIEINPAKRDEYGKLLAPEDIVVECEEYPPECQYVIIVEDQE